MSKVTTYKYTAAPTKSGKEITDWIDRAACKTSGLPSSYWHPDTGWSHRHPYVKAALAVCAACPVKMLCVDHALINEPYGIWGGLTEQQRERHRRHYRLPMLIWRR
jgi:WhiB family redox-sensing transcriptional regulator